MSWFVNSRLWLMLAACFMLITIGLYFTRNEPRRQREITTSEVHRSNSLPPPNANASSPYPKNHIKATSLPQDPAGPAKDVALLSSQGKTNALAPQQPPAAQSASRNPRDDSQHPSPRPPLIAPSSKTAINSPVAAPVVSPSAPRPVRQRFVNGNSVPSEPEYQSSIKPPPAPVRATVPKNGHSALPADSSSAQLVPNHSISAQPSLIVFAGGRVLAGGEDIALNDPAVRALGFSITHPEGLASGDTVRVDWYVDGNRKSFFTFHGSDRDLQRSQAYDNLRPWAGNYEVRLIVNDRQVASLAFVITSQ